MSSIPPQNESHQSIISEMEHKEVHECEETITQTVSYLASKNKPDMTTSAYFYYEDLEYDDSGESEDSE